MGNVLEYIKIVFASHFMRSIMHLNNLNLMKKIVYIQFNYCLQLITILWHYYKLHILYYFFFKEIKKNVKDNGMTNESLPWSWWAGCIIYGSCADPECLRSDLLSPYAPHDLVNVMYGFYRKPGPAKLFQIGFNVFSLII